MATLYPGKGLALYKASSNPEEPVYPVTATIASGSSSIGAPVNAGLSTELNVVFASAPAGTAFNVMYDVVPTFATEYVLEAIAATSDKVYTWTTQGIRLSGFIRVTNSGGQNISSVWLQQTAATFG